MNYPGNLGSPTKEVKDLYNESFQTWKTENKEDTRRWTCPMLMFTSVKFLSSHVDDHEESLVWLTLWFSLLLDHGIHLILNFTLPFDVCQLRSPLYPTLPWMCMNATQSSKANAQPSQKKPNMLVFCSKCVVIWQNDPGAGPHLRSVGVYYWGPVAKMSRYCHQQLREIALVCSHHHLQHTAQEDKRPMADHLYQMCSWICCNVMITVQLNKNTMICVYVCPTVVVLYMLVCMCRGQWL